MPTLNLSASDFDGSNKSFGLLRTNPKISTNVKIVVDSSDNIFLSAFDANSTLSDSRFKRFPVNHLGKYCNDLSNFFKGISLGEIYETKREYSDLAAYSDYSYQYEDTYNSGASKNASKMYGEQYSLFAPIWLKKEIPSKFVIYRVDSVVSSGLDQVDIVTNILSDSSIVKVFDLSKESNIGKYIHNHASDSSDIKSELTVGFDNVNMVSYNGIDVTHGGFISRPDNTSDDLIKTDITEIRSNSIITNGFERNGVVSSSILNLEFMFDDVEAEEFKIYRYFGLYVDSINECNFDSTSVDGDYLRFDKNTVESEYSLTGVTDLEMMPTSFDLKMPTLNYIKDINNKYYHIKNKTNVLSGYIPVGPVNLSDFNGYDIVKGNVDILEESSFKGFIKITIDSIPEDNDRILVGLLQDIISSHNNTYTLEDEATYNFNDFILIADSTIDSGSYINNRFSSDGELDDIASSIFSIIRNILPFNVNVIKDGNSIIIEDFASGHSSSSIMVGDFSLNSIEFASIEGRSFSILKFPNADLTGSNDTNNDNWSFSTLIGGASNKRGLLVESKEIGVISVGDFIKNKNGTYSKLIDIIPNFNDDNYRLIFNSDVNPIGDVIRFYRTFKSEYGKFDAYDIKDFNFDFYDKSMSGIGELEHESLAPDGFWNSTNSQIYSESLDQSFNTKETYVISPNSLDNGFGEWNPNGTAVWNNGQIDITKTASSWEDMFKQTSIPYNTSLKYIVRFAAKADTESIVELYSNSSSDISDFVLIDYVTLTPGWKWYAFEFQPTVESGRLHFVPGEIELGTVFSFSKISLVKLELDSSELNKSTSAFNEYARLNENELKEHAIDSRINPNILKFALKHGTDSRNNKYLLNMNPSFGPDNMSPSIEQNDRDPIKYNLEYFNLAEILDSNKDNEETGFTSYVDECSSCGIIDIDMLKNIDVDYFSRYFNYDGYYNGSSWIDDNKSKQYTIMDGGSSDNFSSTVFKGLRYIYKDRKETNNNTPTEFIKSSKANGYRTSTVLKYVKSTNENPILSNSTSIEVIKNERFKFICTIISIFVVDNDLDQLSLYNMYNEVDILNNGSIVNSILDGLHFKLDNISTSSNGNITLTATDDSISSGSTNLISKITKNGLGTYGYIRLINNNTSLSYTFKVLSVIDNNTITFDGLPVAEGTSNVFNALSTQVSTNIDYVYLNSGDNGFNELFNSVTSGSFASRFNKFEDVKYTRIKYNGTEILNDFAISIEDGIEFIKPVVLDTTTDIDKPKSYSLHQGSIGKVLKKRDDGGYLMGMRRMSGSYEPLFRDVINFTDIYNSWNILDGADEDRHKFIFEKFKGRSVSFNFKGGSLGLVENYFFHKVNDENSENILKLSISSDKLPLYPVIGEIAIDKKTLNVFKSKYDVDFFTRSYPDGSQINVHGTLSPIEKKSFMSSTIMKVEDSYEIMSYDNTQELSLNDLDNIRDDDNSTTGIHWYEDDDRVFADFYVSDSLVSRLNDLGISSSFENYVDPMYSYNDITTIDDDVKLYIESNIVPRFIVDGINMYMIESKSFVTNFVNMVDSDDTLGYSKISNYSIQSLNDGKLSFRLIFNKRVGYNYKFKTLIKIKA